MKYATVLKWYTLLYMYTFKYFSFCFLYFYYWKWYYKFNNMRYRMILRVSYLLQVNMVKVNLQAKDEHYSE
jgi:hypothetical protein